MEANEYRRALEGAAGLLVGDSISRVRYLGWWQATPEEPGAYVEYVELTMDDGAVVRVSTDADDRGSYAISIYEGRYPAPEDAIHVLDASTRGGWNSVVGLLVTTSSIGWANVDVARVLVAKSAVSPSAKPAVSVGMEQALLPCELHLVSRTAARSSSRLRPGTAMACSSSTATTWRWCSETPRRSASS